MNSSKVGTRMLLCVGLWLLAAGCGGAPGEAGGVGGGPNESIAVDEQATQGDCGCNINSYSEYEVTTLQTVVGPSVATNICWMTSIAGFQAASTNPYARVYQQDGKWRMTGINAMMNCLPTCCFHSNGGDADVRWVSQDFAGTAVSEVGQGVKFVNTSLWAGDAMQIFSGLAYQKSGKPMAAGEGEGAAVNYQTQPSDPAVLQVFARSEGSFKAVSTGFAYSFFVGRPATSTHRHVVRKKRYNLSGQNDKVFTLISTSSGICTLDVVQGMSRSNSYAYVHADGSVWKAAASGTAFFYPMCYYFDQDQDL
jgi:hypothetical protein